MTAGTDQETIRIKCCAECGARFGHDATFCPFCGVPLAPGTWDPKRDALAGKVVDDRYEVLAPIGEGGMGTVYKVRHVTLNRHFAMKVLRRDLATDPALAERFVQEARATAAIKHPSVVAITDFGSLERGTPYFVMELLVGETLAAYLQGRGPMEPQEAAKVARLIADALSATHAANVVHRDLKPENVFLVGCEQNQTPTDDIRVVDFGAAKVVGGSKLTRPGVVFGTPYYMSPEQASGQTVDGRADVYSLGVLLYEMLTGRVPFEAETYMGVLTKHMFAVPAKPSRVVAPGVKLGALETVVMRMLEKEPSARYPSMAALGKALEDLESERAPEKGPPSRSSPRTVPLHDVRSTADRIQSSVNKRLAERRREQWRLAAVFVGAAVAMAAVGAILIILATRAPDGGTAQVVTDGPVAAAATVKAPEPAPLVAAEPPPPSAAAPSEPELAPPPQPLPTARPSAPPPTRPTTTIPREAASNRPPAGTSRHTADFEDPWKK